MDKCLARGFATGFFNLTIFLRSWTCFPFKYFEDVDIVAFSFRVRNLALADSACCFLVTSSAIFLYCALMADSVESTLFARTTAGAFIFTIRIPIEVLYIRELSLLDGICQN